MPHLPRSRGLPRDHVPLSERVRSSRLLAAGLLLGAGALPGAACGAAAVEQPAAAVFGSRPGVLPGIAVEGAPLDARALASEAAFLFPDETRALVRGLLRVEFARREAERLGLSVDQAALAQALAEAEAGIRASLPEDGDLEEWSRTRYGRAWSEVRHALEARLSDNQLYQQALRAEAAVAGRVRLHVLVSADSDHATTWARKLRGGADPRALAAESIDPGPRGDSERGPLPVFLPEPLGSALAGAGPGEVVGPFRFEGDRFWHVARLLERIPAERALPPTAQLIASLRERPVDPIEARAWFEEMSRRYTAAERLPAVLAPAAAFVPLQQR